MRWRIAVAACILLSGRSARAHRIDEYLQATVFTAEPHRVEASMRLIPGVRVASRVIDGIDADRDGMFSEGEERTYALRVLGDLAIAVNGKAVTPKLVSWSFPGPAEMREGTGEIRIAYEVELPDGGTRRALTVANHHLSGMSVYLMNAAAPETPAIRILAQKRDPPQTLYELDYDVVVGGGPPRMLWAVPRTRFQGSQFGALFRLGVRHIKEGTDHLLFLLTLLLPAPLLVSRGRWGPPAAVRQGLWRVVGIVTAFTVGHSLTLSLAAFGWVRLPGRPVEVLIAVSILVSALHALRPIFPGKEARIAGFFGLIHGLAFAATLDRLGLDLWDRLTGILAFNLGIETMQMLVVAALLPSLMLMSRTGWYSAFRIGGAVFAGAASVGWIVERLLKTKTAVDAVVEAVARDAVWIAGGLLAVSLACWIFGNGRWRPMWETGDVSSK